jgi:hypothetical protein
LAFKKLSDLGSTLTSLQAKYRSESRVKRDRGLKF